VQVVTVGGGLQEQGRERLGHRGWRVTEADEDLTVVEPGDVVDGEADDAAGGLGQQQHQAGRDPRAQRAVVVEQDATQQLEAAGLSDRGAAADLDYW
jgi:hypothetical protein